MSINHLIPLVKDRLKEDRSNPTSLAIFSGKGQVADELAWNLDVLKLTLPATKENKKLIDTMENDLSVFDLDPISDPEKVFEFINFHRWIISELNNSAFELPSPAITEDTPVENIESGIYHATSDPTELYQDDTLFLDDTEIPYHLVLKVKLPNGVSIVFIYKTSLDKAFYYYHPYEEVWVKVDYSSNDFFIFEGMIEAFRAKWEEVKTHANAVPKCFDFDTEMDKYISAASVIFSNSQRIPRYRVIGDNAIYSRQLISPVYSHQCILVLVKIPGDDNGGIGITLKADVDDNRVDSVTYAITLENDTGAFFNTVVRDKPLTAISSAHVPRNMQREICGVLNKTLFRLITEIRAKSNN